MIISITAALVYSLVFCQTKDKDASKTEQEEGGKDEVIYVEIRFTEN